MRMMLKVSVPVEAGNRSISDGSLPRLMMSFIETHKPEAAYFLAEGGERTALFFLDMKSASDIPLVAESFFMDLSASISLTPAMNVDDMKSGVEKAMKKR